MALGEQVDAQPLRGRKLGTAREKDVSAEARTSTFQRAPSYPDQHQGQVRLTEATGRPGQPAGKLARESKR